MTKYDKLVPRFWIMLKSKHVPMKIRQRSPRRTHKLSSPKN